MASRPRAWSDTRIEISALVAGAEQSVDLLEDMPTLDTRTVIRLIGDLWFMISPNSTIVDSLSTVDIGIGVSSAEAFTIAGAALPNPGLPTQFPPRGWLYVNTQPVIQQAESVGVLNYLAHFKFDLRAMRKVDKGVLFLRMQQANVITGGSMRVIGRVRTLCLG